MSEKMSEQMSEQPSALWTVTGGLTAAVPRSEPPPEPAMAITYDACADILRVRLSPREEFAPRVAGGARLPFGDACVDFAGDGTILVLEVLGASRRYSQDLLGAITIAPPVQER